MQWCNCKEATSERCPVHWKVHNGYMQREDNSVRRVPMAIVNLDTPYYVGTIEALCPPDAMYDVIIENISGAQAAESPDPMWSKVGVVIRGQASRGDRVLPLAVPKLNLWKYIDRDEFARLQYEDFQSRSTNPKIIP